MVLPCASCASLCSEVCISQIWFSTYGLHVFVLNFGVFQLVALKNTAFDWNHLAKVFEIFHRYVI